MEYQKREITCFELSPEAVNRQFLHRMEGKQMSTFPEYRLETSYSPEAWLSYLRQDFGQIEPDTLLEQFAQWGIPLIPERLQDGFVRTSRKICGLRKKCVLICKRNCSPGWFAPR